jgi:hypothetical protein
MLAFGIGSNLTRALILCSLGWVNNCSRPAREAISPAAPQQTAAAAESRAQRPRTFADGLETPVVENKKYGLQCVFHLAEPGAGEGPGASKYVEYVSIRDARTGEEATYKPRDTNDSLLFSQGYFKEVWSPDDEYLLLPFGRFDGFCIIKARGALASVRKRKCFDTLKVEFVKPGAEVPVLALWHEFAKWEGATSFSFRAGLENDLRPFEYDFVAGKLSAPGRAGGGGPRENRELGRNRRGPVEVGPR